MKEEHRLLVAAVVGKAPPKTTCREKCHTLEKANESRSALPPWKLNQERGRGSQRKGGTDGNSGNRMVNEEGRELATKTAARTRVAKTTTDGQGLQLSSGVARNIRDIDSVVTRHQEVNLSGKIRAVATKW